MGSLSEDQNSLCLQQLNMRDGVSMQCVKKDQKSERVPLLSGTPLRLVPAIKAALTEIFNGFASNDDNTMSSDDMKRYILKCGAGESSASNNRIQTIFTRHGTQRSAYQDRLSLNGFFNFYQSACEDRVDHVWNDLGVFKYRYDLRKEDEARKEEEALLNEKPDTLPRHILTSNNAYFDILFRDCMASKSAKIRQMAWKLILRLPTNPGRRQKIMNLTNPNWELLLPSNNLFSLSYGVLICESLTIEPEAAVSDSELEQRAKWRADFLQQKGFEHLIKILSTFKYNGNQSKDADDEDMIEKQTQQLALTAVLKMIQSFFVGAISCNQSMGDVVDQIRSLSLNVSEEEKQNKKPNMNDNVSNTKVSKQKKKKSYQGSNDLYEMAQDYAVLIDSDDDDDDDSNNRDDVEDFTALLEQQ